MPIPPEAKTEYFALLLAQQAAGIIAGSGEWKISLETTDPRWRGLVKLADNTYELYRSSGWYRVPTGRSLFEEFMDLEDRVWPTSSRRKIELKILAGALSHQPDTDQIVRLAKVYILGWMRQTTGVDNHE